MKKFLLVITLVSVSMVGFSQKGDLVPDTLNIKKDTVRGKFVYIKGMDVAVDSGYVISHKAPLIFSAPGTATDKTRTDKVTVLKSEFFILPKKTPLAGEDIIFFKPKQ